MPSTATGPGPSGSGKMNIFDAVRLSIRLIIFSIFLFVSGFVATRITKDEAWVTVGLICVFMSIAIFGYVMHLAAKVNVDRKIHEVLNHTNKKDGAPEVVEIGANSGDAKPVEGVER